MPVPEGATDSAVHDPEAPEPQVRQSRTRARNTHSSGRASGQAVGSAVRSALDVARERWGTPIGPVTVDPEQPSQPKQPGEASPVRRDPLAAWRIWSEPSPSMAAIWADLLDGAQAMAARGWAWLIPYWTFGVLAFPTACLARLLLDSSARPGRYAVLLLAVSLFIVGLSIAGII